MLDVSFGVFWAFCIAPILAENLMLIINEGTASVIRLANLFLTVPVSRQILFGLSTKSSLCSDDLFLVVGIFRKIVPFLFAYQWPAKIWLVSQNNVFLSLWQRLTFLEIEAALVFVSFLFESVVLFKLEFLYFFWMGISCILVRTLQMCQTPIQQRFHWRFHFSWR